MKIVIAPNALKGSLSAQQAAEAMAEGVGRAGVDAEIRCIPVADGGDGLVDALAPALDATRETRTVSGPLGEPVEAGFLYSSTRRLALIETASAAGLALLRPDQYDVLSASTRGVGELIRAALDLGARHIVLGIGGSATHDGGTGLAQALGLRFLDDHGNELSASGAALGAIRHIDAGGLDSRLAQVRLEIACDVDNPLLGSDGAARVYGPQKGASPEQVALLEDGLANLGRVIEADKGRDIRSLPGAGAAGGMGGGLVGFFAARLRPGAELVLDLLGLPEALTDADLVLTAEGQLDAQTRFGKAPAAVARAARTRGVPCIAVAGRLGEGAYTLADTGIDAVFSLCPGPVTLDEARANAACWLSHASEQILRCLALDVAARHHRQRPS